MRIVATKFGNPAEALAVVPSRARPPERGEVTIEVRAAGVNPRDRKAYADEAYAKSRGHRAPEFPLPLGVEAAGIVTAVGPEAVGPAGPVIVGDEVIAYRVEGAYADAITVAASAVVPKPANLSWEQSAAMMLTGTTAVHALAAVRVRRGQTVLIHGAGGGVGLAAVQLAALDGVRVVGTASPGDFDALRHCGAEPVAYGDGLLGRAKVIAPQGYDAAIDLVGADEAVDVSLELVRDRSRIVTAVAFARATQAGFQAIGGSKGEDASGIAIRDAARLKLTALAQVGAYRVRVGQTFPLARAADAHRLLERGHAGGRIVLVA